MNSRKLVINAIAETEKRLLAQQAKMQRHKYYLASTLNDNKAVLLIAGLVVLAFGWKYGRAERTGKLVKGLVNFSFWKVVNNIRNQL